MRPAASVIALAALAAALFVVAGTVLIRPGTAPGPGGEERRRTYDPVRAGEPLPPGYRQLLGRDAIYPVYAPEFVTASESGWEDDTLVIGVAAGGEAKAYPVSFLNAREMVNDELAGSPILVTW